MKYEQYVTYDQSVLLKEKGFPQEVDICDYGYVIKEFYSRDDYPTKYNVGDEYDMNDGYYVNNIIMRPSLFQVQSWLRNEKHISIEIQSEGYNNEKLQGWFIILVNISNNIISMDSPFGMEDNEGEHTVKLYNTYEAALSAGIDKALNLINILN